MKKTFFVMKSTITKKYVFLIVNGIVIAFSKSFMVEIVHVLQIMMIRCHNSLKSIRVLS